VSSFPAQDRRRDKTARLLVRQALRDFTPCFAEAKSRQSRERFAARGLFRADVIQRRSNSGRLSDLPVHYIEATRVERRAFVCRRVRCRPQSILGKEEDANGIKTGVKRLLATTSQAGEIR
jgi:hypothetical protein